MRSVVRRGLVALCLLALGGWAAAATLYKWVDAQGVVHYSDTPHEGAEKIQISGAQTYHNTPSPPTPGTPGSPPVQSGASAGYTSCAIASPSADANLFAPESVEVSVRAAPALHVGDSIVVLMDGQALSPMGADGTRFQIVSPERGAHTLTAQILSADGAVMCNSAPVTFSIQRPSVNSPQSPVRPH